MLRRCKLLVCRFKSSLELQNETVVRVTAALERRVQRITVLQDTGKLLVMPLQDCPLK